MGKKINIDIVAAAHERDELLQKQSHIMAKIRTLTGKKNALISDMKECQVGEMSPDEYSERHKDLSELKAHIDIAKSTLETTNEELGALRQKVSDAGGTLPDMRARTLIDMICPTHGRTSCNDENLNNGFWTSSSDTWHGRCRRCMLLELVRGSDGVPANFDPHDL
jgi:hypothetical protein